MPITVSIIISGRVQGVYFRQSTKEKAAALGLTGEVRNMPDESVRIIATGPSEKLKQLVEWCKLGPPRAVVSHVSVNELPLKSFDKFNVVRL